ERSGFWPRADSRPLPQPHFAGTIGLVAPNAISSLLDHFHHMSATAAALQGSIQFSCGALAGVLVGAFEVDSAWPMVGTMLGAALLGNLGLRLLAGRPVRA
ncbi:MAG: hypothetical protein GX771_02485, partial [Halomonadaceae bacterium]|nr:hypothetical protein [Halomonadaceae bacterium]